MISKSILSLLFLTTLLNLATTKCIHDRLKTDLQYIEIDPLSPQGRILSTTEAIRIYIDYTYLEDAPDDAREYIEEILMPAAVSYFESTLEVTRLQNPIKPKVEKACGRNIPEYILTDGVTADLIIIVTGESSDEDYLAAAQPCLLQSTTSRPTYGEVIFNYEAIRPTNTFQYQNDLLTAIHELVHVLGMTSGLYEKFWDRENQETKTGIQGTATAYNDVEYAYVNVEPLTTMLREHFGCDTIQGIFMENEGTSGSIGSHFERRIFHHEVMTSNDIDDARISKFTLAFLEGTGWYIVNYSMAEPFYWGKDQGCDFYNGPCLEDGPESQFEEYCLPIAAEGCTYTQVAQAYCGATSKRTDSSLNPKFDYWGDNTVVSEPFADNCPAFTGYANVKCGNGFHAQQAKIGAREYFGIGSKCYTGTLSNDDEATSKTRAYCLKSECNDDGTEVIITMDEDTIKCTSEGNKKITGLSGVLHCPDPETFCAGNGGTYCKRGCTGRGTCVDNKCECNAGFAGEDCSLDEDQTLLEFNVGSKGLSGSRISAVIGFLVIICMIILGF